MKIFVKARPNAKEEKIEKLNKAHFIISVKEPAVQGRANQAIIRALAKYFNKSFYGITIIFGWTSRNKICEIRD